MANRISTPTHDKRPRGQICCDIGKTKSYNYITDYLSGNRLVSITSSISSYGVRVFATTWTVRTAAIISASLDNAAQSEITTLVCRTTKLDPKWHNVVFSDKSQFCVQYSRDCNTGPKVQYRYSVFFRF
ncbi:hypothetical protein TNCV_4169811 [Trichonephila clavipes]|nr:hypothetical protein TNCV_4169811 [Trichonephila clavipes]